MAGDLMYVDVAMLPMERPHVPSRTSVPGNTITYAELRVKPRPKGNSSSETSASGCWHRRPAWFYVVLILGVLVLILLGVIAILAKQLSKGRAGKSESLSQHDINSTGDHISSEKAVLVLQLKWLMEELCEDGQRAKCELCPPGWQLHREKCYYFSEEAVSWEDSQRKCLARKSQLLVIEDEIERVSLAAALKQGDRHLPKANISPSEHGQDVRCIRRQARIPSSKEHLTLWKGTCFGEDEQSRAAEKQKRCKCGSQSSFDWEEEMLKTSHSFPLFGSGKRGLIQPLIQPNLLLIFLWNNEYQCLF
ncbi:killer cell lectin-like receptor subfamily F member 1 isoform X1 [Heliangelus exortis]|uniref:killer cell lectin-like receptor subfamily F member 1 isoform X1 n=1 Tax=Heliangelus exortis TaxID=472823 RepID=UPI003A8F6312